jgi:hypothetical protein
MIVETIGVFLVVQVLRSRSNQETKAEEKMLMKQMKSRSFSVRAFRIRRHLLSLAAFAVVLSRTIYLMWL